MKTKLRSLTRAPVSLKVFTHSRGGQRENLILTGKEKLLYLIRSKWCLWSRSIDCSALTQNSPNPRRDGRWMGGLTCQSKPEMRWISRRLQRCWSNAVMGFVSLRQCLRQHEWQVLTQRSNPLQYGWWYLWWDHRVRSETWPQADPATAR